MRRKGEKEVSIVRKRDLGFGHARNRPRRERGEGQQRGDAEPNDMSHDGAASRRHPHHVQAQRKRRAGQRAPGASGRAS